MTDFFDALSRFEYWKRDLVMHKRLRGEPSLDQWIADRISSAPVERLIDIGCGFGTTLGVLRDIDEVHGLTNSDFQKSAAEKLAGPAVKFFIGSFEDPLPDVYDAIVSIESLVFATDLNAAISNLSRHLSPQGRLFVVEDMGLCCDTSPWETAYREGFHLSRVYRARDFESAFANAGLEVEDAVDLTARLHRFPRRLLGLRAQALSFLRRVAPATRWADVASAYWGGVFLERLYADGAFAYRFYELRRREP